MHLNKFLKEKVNNNECPQISWSNASIAGIKPLIL